MEIKQQDMKPGFTQIPNIIIDEWMKILSDVEFRVVMIIARQTYGWIEDRGTGRRKEKDWISQSQLEQKTFRGRSSISKALKNLIENLKIVEAYNEAGEALDTTKKRGACGSKIFYRINTKEQQGLLFPTYPNFRQVQKKRENTSEKKPPIIKKDLPVQNLHMRNLDTTKETLSTKYIKNVQSEKTPSAHRQFMTFWNDEVKRARGINAIITGKDGKNLKRIINFGISSEILEQAAVYYLNDYDFKKFAPSISTFLSAGILNGLLNRERNDPEFWKKLNNYTSKAGKEIKTDNFVKQLRKLKAKFAMQGSEQTKVEQKTN
jgi:hypothetical protein